jgi:hypothetical protein
MAISTNENYGTRFETWLMDGSDPLMLLNPPRALNPDTTVVAIKMIRAKKKKAVVAWASWQRLGLSTAPWVIRLPFK